MTTETGMTGADDHHFFASTEKLPLSHLPCERFKLFLKVRSLTVLPPYKGGIFRSAFGNAFRNAVCAMRRTDCTSCILRGQCLYVSLFEPEAPSDFHDAKKFGHAPPPYVLNPPLDNREVFRPGQGTSFGLGRFEVERL